MLLKKVDQKRMFQKSNLFLEKKSAETFDKKCFRKCFENIYTTNSCVFIQYQITVFISA